MIPGDISFAQRIFKSEETKQRMPVSKKGLHKGMHWKLVDRKRV